jgi:hypothetical protein
VGSVGGESTSRAVVEGVMMQGASVRPLPGGAQLFVIFLGEDPWSFPVRIHFVFVVPRTGCRAAVDIVLVSAEADGTDRKDEGDEILGGGTKGTLFL